MELTQNWDNQDQQAKSFQMRYILSKLNNWNYQTLKQKRKVGVNTESAVIANVVIGGQFSLPSLTKFVIFFFQISENLWTTCLAQKQCKWFVTHLKLVKSLYMPIMSHFNKVLIWPSFYLQVCMERLEKRLSHIPKTVKIQPHRYIGWKECNSSQTVTSCF